MYMYQWVFPNSVTYNLLLDINYSHICKQVMRVDSTVLHVATGQNIFSMRFSSLVVTGAVLVRIIIVPGGCGRTVVHVLVHFLPI